MVIKKMDITVYKIFVVVLVVGIVFAGIKLDPTKKDVNKIRRCI
jgi:hypothetical protein